MGVIIPNPTVETEDGSVSVKNVKKIEVTDGDLTDDGSRVVSINTEGSGGTPAGDNRDIQYNDNGSFGGGDSFAFDDANVRVTLGPDGSTGGTATLGGSFVKLDGGSGGAHVTSAAGDDGLLLCTDDLDITGPRVNLFSHDVSGLMEIATGTGGSSNAITVTSEGSCDILGKGDLNLFGGVQDTANLDVNIRHQMDTTGATVQGYVNIVTADDEDPILRVYSQGTEGNPQIMFDDEATSKTVTLLCDTDGKLKIKHVGAFVFDASSVSGGITFPDGTTQSTAASAGGGGDAVVPYLDGTDHEITDNTLTDLKYCNINAGFNVDGSITGNLSNSIHYSMHSLGHSKTPRTSKR